MPVINLRQESPLAFSDLPFPAVATRTSNPVPQRGTGIYMVLQPTGRTATMVAHSTGGLLPHLFTLTTTSVAVILCYALHTLAGIFPLGSVVLCVVRTFLPLPKQSATDRLAVQFIQFGKDDTSPGEPERHPDNL